MWRRAPRVYGYLPPSTYLVVTPSGVRDGSFVGASPHRASLPAAYQRYSATAADPFYAVDTEPIQVLLRPLFLTSFLIDDQLDDDGLLDRGPILISSASSKTAIVAAFLLARREGVDLVGLTSPRNRDFVEGLGIYGRVLTYDEVDSLDPGPATFVDIAGDASLRTAIHTHFGDDLQASMVVGATHWEDMTGGAPDLPGPTPTLFFAPDRIVKRGKDWGPAGLEERAAAAWHPFADWISTWLAPIVGEGFEAVRDAYREVLDGSNAPNRAYVLTPRPSSRL